MKFLSLLSSVLVLGYSSASLLAQSPPTAPPSSSPAPQQTEQAAPQEQQAAQGQQAPQGQQTEKKELSESVKAEIAAALAGITVENANEATIAAAVLAIVNQNQSFAPEIVALAVESLGKSLVSDSAKAGSVISAVVSEAVKSLPGAAPAIVNAALKALPAEIKTTVAPQVVNKAVESVTSKADKASVLNAAYDSIKNDPQESTIVQSFDQVAKDNKIEVIPNTEQTGSDTRYVLQDDGADESGFGQGVINAGESVPFPSSGSGGGDNTGNSVVTPNPPPAS